MLMRCLVSFTAALCLLTPQQTQPERQSLLVNGYSGSVALGRISGRMCLDVEDLVRVANGSVAFNGDQISLTIPPAPDSDSARTAGSETGSHPGLSSDFMKAGIETVSEMREWASALAYIIQNGYGLTEGWVAEQREKAGSALRLAKAAASTSSDRDAFVLLNNEFNAVNEWSSKLLEAKKSMDTAKYAISPETLRNEPLSQKIISCAHFLDRMLAGGEYQNDSSCH